MDQRSLSSLRKALKRFSPESAIAAAAALQLLPENLDHAVRLEILALVAATTKSRATKALSSAALSELVRDNYLSQLTGQARPGPLVETVTFHGGGYRTLCGPQLDSVFNLRLFLEVFTREHLVPDYSRYAVGLLTAALSVADLVAGRAGFSATVDALDGSEHVTVPSEDELRHLFRATEFSVQQIERYLSDRNIGLRTLGPLIVGIGNVPGVIDVESNPLCTTPLIQVKGHVVVAVPSALHTAAMHHALVAADRRGLCKRVSERLLDIAWRTAIECAHRMDWEPTFLRPPAATIANSRDAILAWDADKLVYVLLLGDSLESYERDPRRFAVDNDALAARIQEIERWTGELQPTPSELLILIVVAGVGRSCVVAPELTALRYADVLTLSLSDLETMSLLERDPLGLWKFQRARRALRETTRVAPCLSGPLTEFWHYLDREHSFYFSEEAPPDFLVFDDAAAGIARQKVALNNDRHAVVGPSSATIVEVARCEQARPIYARLERNIAREFCVSTASVPVWVVSADERDSSGERQGEGPQDDENGSVHLACRAAAFWAAELQPRTAQLLAACTDRLLVRIELEDPEAWQVRPTNPPDGLLVRVIVDRASASMHLTLTSAFAWVAGYPDNRAERALALEYLRGLSELACSQSSEAELESIVNEVAPLGFKKQINLTLSVDRPQLDPRALLPARVVQRADGQFLMDTLGRRVIESMDLPVGDLDPSAAHDVLHRAVAELYAELQRRVATLCPRGLLENLFLANEAIVRKEAEKTTTLAPRLACAENSQEMLQDIGDESVASAESAIGMRFLVEYVAARPPVGWRRLSRSVLDELLAMASTLVFLGTASDVAEFGIGRVHVAALASRRIHVDPVEFNSAMQSYLQIATGRAVDHARGEKQRSRAPDIRALLKAAIASEFGVDSEHAREIVGALFEIGEAQHPSVAVFERGDIEQRVADRVGVELTKVRNMLERLTLTPRANFLSAPKPYEKHDVYPWRFGRGLSLLQRPLVLRKWGGVERLTWGQRQLWSSWHHVGVRLAHGSWRAPKPATKQILSAINDARGPVFEEEVAETLRQQRPELAVRERVIKVGGQRIELGDIDVLVAARSGRRLWLLECKDLTNAITPWTIKHQLEELFVDRPNEKSIQSKHEARVEWARGHVGPLLQLVGENGADWEVRGVIVTAVALVAPLLAAARMPVVAWDEIDRFEF